jgi:hypothetical protein
MKSMTLLIRGIMVSLCALASLTPHHVAAQPPQGGAQNWQAPRSSAWPPAGAHLSGAPNPAVPRGDLRGDIADNARQRSAPPRQEPPPPRH